MSTTRLFTLARPYAEAAFEFAVQNNALQDWENLLAAASIMVKDKQVAYVLNDPNISTHKIISLTTSILASILDEHKNNFIRVLAEKKRLVLLPEILELFRAMRDERENIVEAQVITVFELDQDSKQRLSSQLQKKLNKQVQLQNIVDPNIIGGVIVRYGDEVIDGSIKGKLNRMYESLSA